jgi:hypothetical protein
MKVSEVKIGMKVNIPTTKLGMISYRSAVIEATKHPFLYVVGFANIDGNRVVILSNVEFDRERGGDPFFASELTQFGDTGRKVGSIVQIRTNLSAGQSYDTGVHFARSMVPYMGRVTTITLVRDNGLGYELDIDGGFWNWSPSMVEDVVEIESYECIKAFPGTKVGDVILSSTHPQEYFTSDYFKPVVPNILPKYDLQEYEMEIVGNSVKWGCKTFTKKQIKQVINFVSEFNSMDLHIGIKYNKEYEEINVDKLQAIYDSLK